MKSVWMAVLAVLVIAGSVVEKNRITEKPEG